MTRLACVLLAVSLSACVSTWQRDALRFPSHQAQYVPPTTDKMAARLAEMHARVTGMGVEIVVPDTASQQFWGLSGITTDGQRRIVLTPGLSADAQFEVLVHEAAHLLQPGRLTEAEREVFAERVMVAVCAHYGYRVNVSQRSSQYLAAAKTGFATQKLLAVDYRRAVRVLTGREQP